MNIKDYNLIRDDRYDGYVGIAFAIKGHLQNTQLTFSYLTLPDRFLLLGIQVGDLTVVNMYIPPDLALGEKHLYEIMPHLQEPCMMIGHMNAQNPMWSGMINHNGVVVQRFLQDGTFFMKDGTPTRMSPPE
ncbi:hypothetical protein HHI36_004950 [Cryptolaemus montrouzieri]|uniref:Uncharacterized protein n=1 Tax=Cryptolaemus montrouzieri TaxID=559131 RepID=A0ABD2NSR1_9CUCU